LSQFPSVIAVHDPLPHPGLTDRLFQVLEDWSIRQATRGLVFSQSLAPELAQRGLPLSHIDVISLGPFIYPSWGDTSLHRAEVSDQKPPTLLFFGRITAYKGLGILLEAYGQVAKHRPLRLVVAGEGDLRPYQAKIQSTPGIEVINRWIAEQEIPGIFQQADMVILPYTSASQSGVIPIAAGFGLPVIATRTGGIPEQIEDGENGLLVEPNSAGQLAAAIGRLVTDPALASRLGHQLQADFELKHSWQQVTTGVRASLEKALNLRND
jgi:glycosyltransferase involved in cell wall biosynthesis